MEALKKILVVMVVVLVVLVVGGGLYVASMGGMNHGGGGTASTGQNQNQAKTGVMPNTTTTPQPNTSPQTDANEKTNPGDQQANNQSGSQPTTNQNGTPGQTPNVPAPVIIQVPPQTAKTDPNLYVQQLKERLRSINEANSSIASNTGGQSAAMQPNGAAPSGQTGMNELHQNFYQLGQDVSSMERSLDDLSQNLKESQPANQYGPQPLPNYPYGYPQSQMPYYYQYNPAYPSLPYQANPWAAGQGITNQNQTGQQQNPQQSNQSNQSNNMSMNQPSMNTDQSSMNMSQSSMNHSSLSSFLNTNVFKIIFVIILLFSVIFGIVSVIGFIGSLFKSDAPKEAAGN